jgi:hypothetical protein
VQTTKGHWIIGAVCITAGLLIIAVATGALPVPPEDVHAPMWVLFLSGLVFILGGAMALAGPKARVTSLGAALMCVCFGLVGGWVAIAAPPGSISGGIPLLSQASNEAIGRCLFGGGALLCFGIAALAVRQFLRPS